MCYRVQIQEGDSDMPRGFTVADNATIALIALLSSGIVVACSSQGAEAEVPTLTEQTVRTLGMQNFVGTIDANVELLKKTWCAKKYERYKSDVGAKTDDDVRQVLTVPKDQRPKNPQIMAVTDVHSSGTSGSARVRASNEVPVGDGTFRRIESVDKIAFVHEAGSWRVCSDVDDPQ